MRRFWVTLALGLALLLGAAIRYIGIQAAQSSLQYREMTDYQKAADEVMAAKIRLDVYTKWLELEYDDMLLELQMRHIRPPNETRRKI